jgi:hypothetical protein
MRPGARCHAVDVRRATMYARLLACAALIGSLVFAAAAARANDQPGSGSVLRTMGFTDIRPATQRCGAYVARVRLGRRVGTRTVVVGSDVVRAGVMVPRGTATLCVRKRVDHRRAGIRRTSASGTLTLRLRGGTIEAAFSERRTARGDGKAAYSSVATITRGTGRYRAATGTIRGRGTMSMLSSTRQCWHLAFTVELL